MALVSICTLPPLATFWATRFELHYFSCRVANVLIFNFLKHFVYFCVVKNKLRHNNLFFEFACGGIGAVCLKFGT